MPLVCTGMRMWVLEASGVPWQDSDRWGWGVWVQADLILLSSGAAALRLCRCTCLLFILRSGKDGGRKPHFLPSEGALVFPQLPRERHFCLAVKYIALHLLLMRFALVFFFPPPPLSPFSFRRETLNLRARRADFIPSRLTENLRGSVGAQSLKGKVREAANITCFILNACQNFCRLRFGASVCEFVNERESKRFLIRCCS